MSAWGWLTEVGIIADWRDDEQGGPLAGPLTEAEARQIAAARTSAELQGPLLPLAAVPGDGGQVRFEVGGELIALVELQGGRARLTAPTWAAPAATAIEAAERALLEQGAATFACGGCGARVAAAIAGRLVALPGVSAGCAERGGLMCADCARESK